MPDGGWGAYGKAARAGLIAALAVPLLAKEAHSAPNQSADEHPIAAGERQDRKPLGVLPQNEAHAVRGNDDYGPNKVEHKEQQWGVTDLVQAGSAAIAALSAAILAIFAGLQIRIYVRQTRVMDLTFKATARAVRASQRSARATEGAVAKSDEMLAHSREAMERSIASSERLERAYMFVGIGEIVFDADNLRTQITVRVGNAGKTPGFLEGLLHKAYAGEQLPLEPPMGQCTVFPTDIVIPSGESEAILVANHLWAATGDLFCYFGEISYRDIFGSYRTSRFCIRVSLKPTITCRTWGMGAWHTWT